MVNNKPKYQPQFIPSSGGVTITGMVGSPCSGMVGLVCTGIYMKVRSPNYFAHYTSDFAF